MAEKKEKKKKARGFAGVIAKNLEPLNSNEKFKEKYKDTKLKLLLNAKDGRWAALIIIDNGILNIEGVKNSPKENISKEALGWEGLLETSTPLFLDIASGKLSTGGMLIKIITRKIKIKGMKKVAVLSELFALLENKEEE
ncbi:MAG: hypothetical protein ACTSRI_02095 [Promethearchaeota archaeon]